MKIPFVPLLLIVGAIVRAAAQDVSTNSHSPDVITVAVFDFGSPYKVRLRNDIGLVSSVLTANLSSNPQLTVVDRAELNKVLKEQGFGLSGNISPETAAKNRQARRRKSFGDRKDFQHWRRHRHRQQRRRQSNQFSKPGAHRREYHQHGNRTGICATRRWHAGKFNQTGR